MKNFISINFSYIRKTNYLSQKELADKYELSSNVIGTYERGISLPTITLLQKICKDFDVNLDDFVNTDLSKRPGKDYVQEQSSEVVAATEIRYLERMVKVKDETIAAKDQIISEKDKQLEVLERHRVILETLLNQNNTLAGLKIAKKEE